MMMVVVLEVLLGGEWIDGGWMGGWTSILGGAGEEFVVVMGWSVVGEV